MFKCSGIITSFLSEFLTCENSFNRFLLFWISKKSTSITLVSPIKSATKRVCNLYWLTQYYLMACQDSPSPLSKNESNSPSRSSVASSNISPTSKPSIISVNNIDPKTPTANPPTIPGIAFPNWEARP